MSSASREASSACPMQLEKPKNDDIHINEANVKGDYVRYTVQDKVRFPDSIFESCKNVG
ncbi:hypothetical protein BDF20DRAFT_818108 [Mycotypha africana]|uniref:uncharacterized protein n=1 Tax=Mycotypha africana TaxID=64632 RepID=UPI0023015CF3|nr:uncharacterized protein BDF20DRAFT_818108 [Mycotypha africana]KAI8982162.1 hypothetical protein BDF20DRAFT_818108 [Mycotypha africana]